MYKLDVYSPIILLLIVATVDEFPIFVTFTGKFTGGIVAAFETSTIVVPGTCGCDTALASIIYAEKVISKWPRSLLAVATANTLRSHNPVVKNGWLVNCGINPANAPAHVVKFAPRLTGKLFWAFVLGIVDN